MSDMQQINNNKKKQKKKNTENVFLKKPNELER